MDGGRAALEQVLRHPAVWQGGRSGAPGQGVLPSGLADLDAALPGGGWPLGALTEVLCGRHGVGELRLLMPALARLTGEGRGVVWIAPPYLPYPPALSAWGMDLHLTVLLRPGSGREALWAAEQALRWDGCGAVLLWPAPADATAPVLRRLQLAAETGGGWGVVFGAPESRRRPSPAALRLWLEAAGEGLDLHVLKCRGRPPSAPIRFRTTLFPAPCAPSRETALPLARRSSA